MGFPPRCRTACPPLRNLSAALLHRCICPRHSCAMRQRWHGSCRRQRAAACDWQLVVRVDGHARRPSTARPDPDRRRPLPPAAHRIKPLLRCYRTQRSRAAPGSSTQSAPCHGCCNLLRGCEALQNTPGGPSGAACTRCSGTGGRRASAATPGSAGALLPCAPENSWDDNRQVWHAMSVVRPKSFETTAVRYGKRQQCHRKSRHMQVAPRPRLCCRQHGNSAVAYVPRNSGARSTTTADAADAFKMM